MARTEYCVVDTGPLINFALGDALSVLTAATEVFTFKLIDVIEMEATLPGKPGSAEIAAWIKEQQARGTLEIIETETGRALAEGRKTDPHFRIRHGGEHAICDWLGSGAVNDADQTVVVYEDKGMMRNLNRMFFEANIAAATPRAFLEIGQRLGFVDSAADVWEKMAAASPTRSAAATLDTISRKPPQQNLGKGPTP